MLYIINLVGGFNPSEKYESIGIIIPNIWKNKTCSKPPTSYQYIDRQTTNMTILPDDFSWLQPLTSRRSRGKALSTASRDPQSHPKNGQIP